MATTLTALPSTIASGTTVIYRRALSEYPADAGWTLTLYIRGLNVLTKPASADGATHVVTLAATDTDDLAAGLYTWVERVSKAGEVYDVASGSLTVTPNVATATAGQLQPFEERALAVCRARLENRLTADQEQFQIYGRAVTRIPVEQLLQLITYFEQKVAAKRPGARFGRPVLGRFSGTGEDR